MVWPLRCPVKKKKQNLEFYSSVSLNDNILKTATLNKTAHQKKPQKQFLKKKISKMLQYHHSSSDSYTSSLFLWFSSPSKLFAE